MTQLKVRFETIERIISGHRDEWKQLTQQRPLSSPFLDEHWVAAFRDAFAAEPSCVAAVWADEQLVGLAPVRQLREVWYGKQLRVLQSLTNVWSYRFEFLADSDREGVLRRLWHFLLSSQVCDVVRVEMVPEGSPTLDVGISVARALGWHSACLPINSSPWRNLAPPLKSWHDGLKSKFLSNLRNREKRLALNGSVSFEVVREAGRLSEALTVFYDLEATGWKAERGTAIKLHPGAKRFFDDFVMRVAGEVWVTILRVDKRPIAAQLIQTRHRTIFLLKVAYDPTFSAYGPGQLIMARTMAYGMEQGMMVLDFLGEQMTWKMDWNPNLRTNYMLALCAPTMAGQYGYWMRHGLRRFGHRIPGADRFVRWLRQQSCAS